MKNMTLTIALAAAAMTALSACSDNDPVLTQRDWDGDNSYFASSDLQRQDIYYKPSVGYVGDPMPFYDQANGDFKILYLQDFRPNPAYTYHPIWCLSTTDAASYTSLGEIISTGSATDLDAAIGTGSTIYENGTYYTFYTGHSADASKTNGLGEAVMLATSTDFKNWTKNRSLIISGETNYNTTDFRDPCVFKGDDGIFHMLVSTRQNGKGVLAEFISSDLQNWTDNGVFMTMMWDRFYECPDLFKMGDWWYLIYSEQHDAIRKVQYFKGRTLADLKACTANDAGLWPDSHEGFLDSRGLYAGKTASNGTDRYIWGWCATRSGDDNLGSNDWAGNLVAHKLIQHADGTLTLGEVPAIANLFGNGSQKESFSLSGDSYKLMSRLSYTNRVSFTVTLSDVAGKFGISLGRGSDSTKYYTLVVNPESSTVRKINFEEEGSEGSGFIGNADSYVFNAPEDGVYNITMVTDNSVVTLYINDVLAYTNRVYGIARNCWSINSYGTDLQVSNLSVASK
jgi:beta-fructofuranosidase